MCQTKNRFVAILWSRYNSHTGITGWYLGKSFRNQFLELPPAVKLDSHFSYPFDGAFHYSHKFINKNSEQYVTIYWNRVRVKTIENGGSPVEENFTREEFKVNMLGHMVSESEPVPINQTQFFQFISMGFNVLNGDISRYQGERTIKEPRPDDLVVDVSHFYNYAVTAFSRLRSPDVSITKLLDSKEYIKTIALTDKLNLEIGCLIMKNASLFDVPESQP